MNQQHTQKSMLVALGAAVSLTVAMGWLVLRMEQRWLDDGRSGFEGDGGLLLLIPSVLAALMLYGLIRWRLEGARALALNPGYVSRPLTLGYLVLMFIIGALVGPGVLNGGAWPLAALAVAVGVSAGYVAVLNRAPVKAYGAVDEAE